MLVAAGGGTSAQPAHLRGCEDAVGARRGARIRFELLGALAAYMLSTSYKLFISFIVLRLAHARLAQSESLLGQRYP